ncbi:MAG: tRNA preQ1(34) S-adenosylmethionine ribosyltransferase-isomerase QueA [Planctomycetota bacterium]|jgi:S-adenosylmethionine:tRNA ribosyltransferase-isomerase|nr:tRNA preQ1(34) S-adenosylmethionine ribosyltransferase-isomerase QueA [Planctomycetota bacterium]
MDLDGLLRSYLFDLPPELIAQRPAARRDASRLMLVGTGGELRDLEFGALPGLLAPGDLLVRNNAKVLPARLLGRRPGGGKTELLLVRRTGGGENETWLCLARPASHLKAGTAIGFAGGALAATVVDRRGKGEATVAFSESGERFKILLREIGLIPLPPYIERPGRIPTPEDVERYQTVYARNDKDGAVAAPTAGLHFTPGIDRRLAERGVEIAELTLYVGPGTFRPIKAEKLDDHRMDAERFEIPGDAWRRIREAKRAGRRVVAVGTTTARALESAGGAPADENGDRAGWTGLFIRPGHDFRVVDGLLTNFHLPGSSLLVMLSAFAGRERMLAAYRRAAANGYRFYSYGDAMLAWRADP